MTNLTPPLWQVVLRSRFVSPTIAASTSQGLNAILTAKLIPNSFRSFAFRHVLLALVVGLLLCALTPPAQTQHKRALLIGVHVYQYGPDSVFSDLNTESDVAAVRQVLMDRFGFAAGDIRVLTTGPETTRAAMTDPLVTPTQPGDIVYFHYSGHGSQDPDPANFSSVEETLVPSD